MPKRKRVIFKLTVSPLSLAARASYKNLLGDVIVNANDDSVLNTPRKNKTLRNKNRKKRKKEQRLKTKFT